MKTKVKIVVSENNHYHYSTKNGRQFTSVDYDGRKYGGASPCDTAEEVKSAIKHARENILREGDIPILEDNRKRSKLTFWV